MENEKDKYSAQKKYLRANYVRFPLDLKPDLLERFKAKCNERGTNPTAAIKKFIDEFCEDKAEDE